MVEVEIEMVNGEWGMTERENTTIGTHKAANRAFVPNPRLKFRVLPWLGWSYFMD